MEEKPFTLGVSAEDLKKVTSCSRMVSYRLNNVLRLKSKLEQIEDAILRFPGGSTPCGQSRCPIARTLNTLAGVLHVYHERLDANTKWRFTGVHMSGKHLMDVKIEYIPETKLTKDGVWIDMKLPPL